MYSYKYSEKVKKILKRLFKKDPKHYSILFKKIEFILTHPKHKYKDLHYDMKGVKRVHIGHFVLVFILDPINKIVSFENYDHHDKIYS